MRSAIGRCPTRPKKPSCSYNHPESGERRFDRNAARSPQTGPRRCPNDPKDGCTCDRRGAVGHSDHRAGARTKAGRHPQNVFFRQPGKPFTARNVKCTWDLLQGKSAEKLRLNPRKAWYLNLDEVVTNGDFEVTFRLKRPQPAFVALLASGFSPVYPCHVSARDMRQHPIGTGPFKFVEFKPNELIKVTRNPDYWKKDRHYLDGIEYHIIKTVATGVLRLVSGKFDMTSPYFLQV